MRIKTSRFLVFSVLLLLIITLAGCGDKVPSILTEITFSASDVTMDIGEAKTVTVIGKDQNGKTMATKPTFALEGNAIVELTPRGAGVSLKATTYGTTTLKATVGTFTISLPIHVALTSAHIEKFMNLLTQAYKSKEPGTIAAYYADPAYYGNDQSAGLASRAAIEQDLRNTFEYGISINIGAWTQQIVNNIATVNYSMVLSYQGNSIEIPSTLKIQNRDGKLYIIEDIAHIE